MGPEAWAVKGEGSSQREWDKDLDQRSSPEAGEKKTKRVTHHRWTGRGPPGPGKSPETAPASIGLATPTSRSRVTGAPDAADGRTSNGGTTRIREEATDETGEEAQGRKVWGMKARGRSRGGQPQENGGRIFPTGTPGVRQPRPSQGQAGRQGPPP